MSLNCDKFVWVMTRILLPVAIIAILSGCVIYVLSFTPDQNIDDTSRTYYIAATEVVWDYSPYINESTYDTAYQPYIEQYLSETTNPPRLGSSYLKAVFRQYTDSTFQTESPRPEWLGILGPVIKAEVGDTVKVHFFNNATIPLSVHPHGFSYNKRDEGAYYQDNSTSQDRGDDMVPPKESYIYTWTLPDSNSPADTDDDCLTMAYHSHVKSESEIHSGLIGPLVICKRGSLSSYEEKEKNTVFLMFLIFDENESLYIDRNIERKFSTLSSHDRDNLKEDEEFQQSNRMHTVNGHAFNSLRGLEFCVGDRIEWRMIGMGNEMDIHSITFQNHLVKLDGHRTNVVSLVPAKFTTSIMSVRHEGTWKIVSETGTEFLAGMEVRFIARRCSGNFNESNENFTIPLHSRTFYIAAEEIQWDYAPSNLNKFNNVELKLDEHAAVFFDREHNRIGGTYKKAVYRSYSDESFTIRNNRSEYDQHLGLLGPTIRIEVGETIKLIFKNKASRTYSIYSPAVEIYHENGTYVKANSIKVEAGSSLVLYWYVPDYYGPSEVDPQCLTWRYYSDVNFLKDAYSGLNGILLTCKRHTLNENGRQRNINKEFSLIFAVMDENESNYIDENILTYCNDPQSVDKLDEDFQESNKMHSINGLMYGNLKGLIMEYNDTVSWHIVAIGKASDLHTAYFHGETFLRYGTYKDSFVLLPSMHFTVVMLADNPGEWELECKTVDHYQAGMRAKYQIKHTSENDTENITEGSKMRTYYIAAVEQEWDYATHPYHLITGELLTENEESKTFVERGDERIGKVYKKVIYQQYSDPEFSRLISKPSHLGILGPMIKAEIGETIRVVFKNMAHNRPFSIRLQGVVAISEMSATSPNETRTYLWKVLERSGPGNSEFNCTSWAYYSDVDVAMDTNSGLVGPLIICKKGILRNTDERTDVEREFALLFTVFDENMSWFLRENIETYCYNPQSVDPENEDFKESNLMHAINGRIYGSLEGLEADKDDRVAWYFIGLGNEVDVHTAHFHGITFVGWHNGKHRSDVLELYPGIFETAQMIAKNPGKWLLHCHVDDHVKAGMNTLFTINDN